MQPKARHKKTALEELTSQRTLIVWLKTWLLTGWLRARRMYWAVQSEHTSCKLHLHQHKVLLPEIILTCGRQRTPGDHRGTFMWAKTLHSVNLHKKRKKT